LSTPEQLLWGHDWTVGLYVWVRRAGLPIFGKGRLELLEHIDRSRSISAAAREMGMSYRRAWLLVQSINEAAGQPLVVAAAGGVQGGGAALTPLGRRAVTALRELQDHVNRTAAGLLHQLLQPPVTPELHVVAAVSLEEVLGQLLIDYAFQQPTVRVRAVFGASDELADHLLAGAPADLFLSADPRSIDRLEAASLVEPGSRVLLAENSLAAITLADHSVQAKKMADLLEPPTLRFALAGADCPLGRYTQAFLESQGLGDAMAGRVVRVDNSRAVVTAVRAGQADVGLAYASDAAQAGECRLLFRIRRLPAPVQYVAAILRDRPQLAAARQFLTFLTSPTAADRFRRCDFLIPRQGHAPRGPRSSR
jgi:molybdenum ABC transporter molybdate-binding protein